MLGSFKFIYFCHNEIATEWPMSYQEMNSTIAEIDTTCSDLSASFSYFL